MYNTQHDLVINKIQDLITWFNSDVVINDPEVATLFVERQIRSVFGIPPIIPIYCHSEKIQIGKNCISYPFFFNGLSNMIEQVLKNRKEHSFAIMQQTQNSLFDT